MWTSEATSRKRIGPNPMRAFRATLAASVARCLSGDAASSDVSRPSPFHRTIEFVSVVPAEHHAATESGCSTSSVNALPSADSGSTCAT